MLAPEDVAEKAIVLLKDTFTNLGPRLQQNQIDIHEDFIQTTMDRLKVSVNFEIYTYFGFNVWI